MAAQTHPAIVAIEIMAASTVAPPRWMRRNVAAAGLRTVAGGAEVFAMT